MDTSISTFAGWISYISQIFLLHPGDLILTGSPAGIGALTKKWLRPGDRIEITVPEVGTLSNSIELE